MRGILLRQVVGETLRELRGEANLTLRAVSTGSMVSLGYLSEIERGHKEASSEVLNSICSALGITLGDLLGIVAVKLSVREAAGRGISVAA